MGGVQFFTVCLETPEANRELMYASLSGMNQDVNPEEGELKGGAKGLGKVGASLPRCPSLRRRFPGRRLHPCSAVLSSCICVWHELPDPPRRCALRCLEGLSRQPGESAPRARIGARYLARPASRSSALLEIGARFLGRLADDHVVQP